MKNYERQEFIEELIGSVKEEIISKSPNMPDSWDGIELRQYIADRFSDAVIKRLLSGSRKRAYKNTLLISNL